MRACAIFCSWDIRGASAGLRVDFVKLCNFLTARPHEQLYKPKGPKPTATEKRFFTRPPRLLSSADSVAKNSAGPKFSKTGWFGAWREMYEVQVPECAWRRAVQRIQCALEIDAIRHAG